MAIGRVPATGRRIANLAKLLHSLRTGTDEQDRVRLIDVYEGDEPVLGERVAALARIHQRVEAGEIARSDLDEGER